MRHYKKGRKLGTDASHTKAIKKNLAVALFTNDRIKTTLPRAKEVRGYVDHIITLAKRGDLHARRQAIAKLGDKELVREVFEKAAQGMWADRNGGYTRILKLGRRKGDNAPIAILELVQEAVVTKTKPEPKDEKKSNGKAAKKASETEEAAKDEGVEETAADDAEEAADKAPGTEEAAEPESVPEAESEGADEKAEEKAE